MNFGSTAGGNDRPPMGIPPQLVRQPSIYSLTFDEFQSTLGCGLGKDFGSMNMDELLRNIWTAEETQPLTAAAFAVGEGVVASSGSGVPLQRQESLKLPRTLSQKTVDEVWRDISSEVGSKGENRSSGMGGPQRQQTLGEMTLEEFLVRAGVVKEDIQLSAACTTNIGGFYEQLPRGNNDTGLTLDFQNPGRSNQGRDNFHQIPPNQLQNLAIDVSGCRTPKHQLFPKPANTSYASSMQLGNKVEPGNQSIRSGVAAGLGDQAVNSSFMRGDGGNGQRGERMGLGAGGISVPTDSPSNQLSLDRLRKSNGEIPSVSPVLHPFNANLRGTKCGQQFDRGVEKKQRRMIKNRESAARSRARKQAYTRELEAEVAKLKEQNTELQEKQLLQAQIMETRKKLVLGMIDQQQGLQKQSLKRTLTGPW